MADIAAVCFSLTPPFAPAHTRAVAEEYQSWTDRSFRPVLRALDESSGFVCACASATFYWEWLAESKHGGVFKRVLELQKAGRLEILGSLEYNSDIAAFPPELRKLHPEHEKRFWESHGVKNRKGFFLESDHHIGQTVALIQQYGFEYCVLPTQAEKAVPVSLLSGERSKFPVVELAPYRMDQKGGPQYGAYFVRTPVALVDSLLSSFKTRDMKFVLPRDLLNLASKGEERASIPDHIIQNPSESANLRVRLSVLTHQLAEARGMFANHPPDHISSDRLYTVEKYLLSAAHLVFAPNGADLSPLARQSFFDSVTRAQVELDTLFRPEVDPVVGWINAAVSAERKTNSVIDTQLMRWELRDSPEGNVTSLEYKPRKLNMAGDALYNEASPGLFGAHLRSKNERVARTANVPAKLLRNTPDVAIVRFQDTFTVNRAPFTINKDFTIKAGVGAHLANATTGCSVEFWIEGDSMPSPDTQLAITFNWTFPSLNPAGVFSKVLMCVGGMAEHSEALNEPINYAHDAVPGGLYGLRFIDGIDEFVFDVRSSKQLNAISLKPLMWQPKSPGIAPQFECVEVQFLVDARRVFGDDKTLVLFLSIV